MIRNPSPREGEGRGKGREEKREGSRGEKPQTPISGMPDTVLLARKFFQTDGVWRLPVPLKDTLQVVLNGGCWVVGIRGTLVDDQPHTSCVGEIILRPVGCSHVCLLLCDRVLAVTHSAVRDVGVISHRDDEYFHIYGNVGLRVSESL